MSVCLPVKKIHRFKKCYILIRVVKYASLKAKMPSGSSPDFSRAGGHLKGPWGVKPKIGYCSDFPSLFKSNWSAAE